MKISTALSRLLFASTALFVASALAATPWTGDEDSDWAEDDNWDGTAPGVTVGDTTADTATFGNAPDSTTVTVDADRLIHSLFFEGINAPAYTFDGATLRLAAGGDIRRDAATGTGDITFENAILLQPETTSSDGTFTIAERASNSAFFFEGGITGGDTTGNLDLILDGTSNFRVWFTGPINDGDAGSVSLISNTASGTVTLDSTASDYSGGTFVNTDTLFRLRESNVFGTGDITISTGAMMDMLSISRNPEDPALSSRLSFDNDIHLSGTLHSTNAGYFTDLTGDITLGGQAGADPRIGNTGRQTTLFGVISDATGFEGALGLVGNGNMVFVNEDNDFAGGIYNTGSVGGIALRHDTSLGTGPILINSDPAGININYGLTFTTPGETNFDGGAVGDYRFRELDNDLILNGRFRLFNPNWLHYTFNGDITLGTVANAQPKFQGRTRLDELTLNSEITDGGFDLALTVQTGTLILTQNNSLANDIVLIDGTDDNFNRPRLLVGTGGATGLIGTGEVQLGDHSELRFNRTGTYTVENLLTGTGNFFVEGGGTATLDQANTYAGTTSVTGNSTLIVEGSHSGGGSYTIAGGSTLGGSGSIGVGDNSITLASGSFLAPGGLATPGTLNISMTASGTMDLSAIAEFGTDNFIFRLGSASDSVAVTGGTVNFGFDFLGWDDFDFILGSGFGPGTYTLFSSNGGLFGGLDADATEGVLNGFDSFLTLDANALTLTVIPEPATVAGILGALALGLALWRRKRCQFKLED